MAPSVYKNKFTRRCRRGRDAAWTSRPSPRTLPFSEGAPEVLVRAWRLGSLLKDSGVPSHAELRALGGAAQVAASALATCPPPARVPGGGGVLARSMGGAGRVVASLLGRGGPSGSGRTALVQPRAPTRGMDPGWGFVSRELLLPLSFRWGCELGPRSQGWGRAGAPPGVPWGTGASGPGLRVLGSRQGFPSPAPAPGAPLRASSQNSSRRSDWTAAATALGQWPGASVTVGVAGCRDPRLAPGLLQVKRQGCPSRGRPVSTG